MHLASLLPWPYRLLALTALAVTLFGSGYLQGRRAEQAVTAEASHTAVVRVLRQERQQAAISQHITRRHEVGRAADRVIYQTIERDMERYVDNPDHLSGRLDRGWVCQHDAAALRTVPDPACRLDARASTYTSDDALRTAIGNYQACHDNARQLMDLQQWVTAQQALTQPYEEERDE